VRTTDRRATAPTGIRRVRAVLSRRADPVVGSDPGPAGLPHSRPRAVPPPLA
jgi:hypothetical protein